MNIETKAKLIPDKSLEAFDREMRSVGWSVFPKILPPELVKSMYADALKWVERCRQMQIKTGINENGDGTAHHAIGDGDALDVFFHQHLFHSYLTHFFNDKPYITHAMNPVCVTRDRATYIQEIHRDTNTVIPGYRFRINMLVMLTDFTLENGATQILPGSQAMERKPSNEEFEKGYKSMTGTAGTVILFDSYLWHRGGKNTTSIPRVGHTLSFGPAFVKPQMDYARMLGEEAGKSLSALSRQVLGYNARVPISHEEWYRKSAARLYQADQG